MSKYRAGKGKLGFKKEWPSDTNAEDLQKELRPIIPPGQQGRKMNGDYAKAIVRIECTSKSIATIAGRKAGYQYGNASLPNRGRRMADSGV